MEQLGNVLMNNKEILQTSIENLIKLFQRRKYLENGQDKIDKIISSINENDIAMLQTPTHKISIYFKQIDVSNISAGSSLDEFMSKDLDTLKFIIINSFSKKVYKQIQEYKNSEVFRVYEMLEDIPSKSFIPEHTLLTTEDEADITSVYKKEQMAQIKNTDMMCRYYGGKVGNVFRINRYNVNSGYSSYYRVVVNDPGLSMFG